MDASKLNILEERLRRRDPLAKPSLGEQAAEWKALLDFLEGILGKKPDMNAILFLVGVNVLGKGPDAFTKEEKQDLMHVAVCELLSFSEFYAFEGRDESGWPHYRILRSTVSLTLAEQEAVLRACAVQYFRETNENFNPHPNP